MTLPAAPPMSMAQMVAEFGIALPAVFPRDFYGKGGAPAAGNLSFSDFLGRSNVTFDQPPGNYSAEGVDTVNFAITCSKAAVWTWTKGAGVRSSATPASGSSSATWNGGCSSTPGSRFDDPGATGPNSATFTVNANVDGVNYGPWTIALDCTGNGA